MSDILWKLELVSGAGCDWRYTRECVDEAAAEIVNLRAQLAEVKRLVSRNTTGCGTCWTVEEHLERPQNE